MRHLRRPGSGRCVLPLTLSSAHTSPGKQRMVHALCGLNEVTTKRPCKYELIRDLPAVLHPDDWMLLVDAKTAFWSVLIHPQNQKFMSNHYALPTFYKSEGKTTFVSHQPGRYWALQQHLARARKSAPTEADYLNSSHVRGSLRPQKPTTSTPPGLRETYIQIIKLSHAVTPFRWMASPRIWVTVFRVVVATLQ